ncbi:MAG: hypothetical protein HY581_01430 [Nitrospirae bacterium]|nr:hypothetical protein [Nitrospirota bacterium]
MRHRDFLLGSGLVLIAVVLAGCATGPMVGTGAPGVAIQPGPADPVFHYRQQAADLRNMAKRLEMEAAWFEKQGEQGQEQAKRSRDMARDFVAAAEQADQQATEYQRRVPHGQLY